MATDRPYHSLSVIPNIDQLCLERVGQGKSLKSIATEFGVTDVAVLHRLQQHPAYRRHLEIGTELRMDQRESELEGADTNVSVTRADRLLGHARWIAERACPAKWGAKQQLEVIDPAHVVDRALADLAVRLVERMRDYAIPVLSDAEVIQAQLDDADHL